MTDGRLLLAIVGAICVLAFLNGLRFSRISAKQPFKGQITMPAWLARGRTSGEQLRLVGRTSMIAAPLLFIFFVAICFGLFGPVHGIQIISV